MSELYKGIAGSPITYLAGDISAAQTTIAVGDDTALPDAPNICTIGFGEKMETIRYDTKEGSTLSDITRGIEGTPQAWPSGTEVARFFTAYDHNAIIEAHKAHLADYSMLKEDMTTKIHSSNINENITITLPGRGNYLCAIGYGIAGQSGAGALYFLSYWSDAVYGISPIVENSRFTVTLNSDGVVTVERASGWMTVSLTNLS